MDLEHPNGNQNHMIRKFNSQCIYTISFAIPEGYSLNLEYLGGGTYGNVVKSEVLCRDGIRRVVAIKKLKDPFMDALQARRIYREIKLLQLIRHDNIIRAIDLYTPAKNEHEFRDIYVVTEYAGNSLAKVLQNQRDSGRTLISPEHVQFIIYQLLRAVKYLHSVAIMHRDLKPGNLALTKDCDLTVLDFGLARSLERKDTGLTQYVMTRWYRSPEVIYWKIGNYSTQADIWSIGCIAAELMMGTPIFEGDDANSQYESIIRITGSPSSELLDMIEQENGRAMRNVIEQYSPRNRVDFQDYFSEYGQGFADFLDQIMVLDPEQRLTVDQALAHPYMHPYHDLADEPSADWNLVDDEERSLAEWKNIIWREVTGFSGDQESPLIPF